VSETVTLKANDGHELDTYVSSPSDPPIAGLVVIQEAFGVNRHIRSVADGFAKDGFLAVAPALFDRIQPGIELGYDPADLTKGDCAGEAEQHRSMPMAVAIPRGLIHNPAVIAVQPSKVCMNSGSNTRLPYNTKPSVITKTMPALSRCGQDGQSRVRH
jgi:dienelactone hydrolase